MEERVRNLENWKERMDVRFDTLSKNLVTNTMLTESVDRKMNEVLSKVDATVSLTGFAFGAFKWTITTIVAALSAYAAFHFR